MDKVEFYKESDKYGFRIIYSDSSRENFDNLPIVEGLDSLLNLMSDFEDGSLYGGINNISFTKDYNKIEKNILETVTQQYIKSSNKINELENRLDLSE